MNRELLKAKLELMEAHIARVEKLRAELALDRHNLMACTETTCSGEGCGTVFEIGALVYMQTHWYVEPYGCTDGDYWNPGEGQWVCPECGHRNRLISELEHLSNFKRFFKAIKDVYDD